MLRKPFLVATLVFASGLSSAALAQVRCEQVFRDQLSMVREGTNEILDGEKRIRLAQRPTLEKEGIETRAKKAWKGSFKNRVKFLDQVHSEMYFLFPGRELEIDRIMTAVKSVTTNPTPPAKPIVIDLFGFPGDGKTAMVNKLSELLALGNRFKQVNIKDGQVAIEPHIFRHLSDQSKNEESPPVSFLVLDEWQKFKPLKDLVEDASPTNEDGSTVTRSEGYTQKVINEKFIRTASIRMMYDIYGNGTERANPDRSFQNILTNLDDYIDSIHDKRKAVASILEKLSAKKSELEKSEPDEKKDIQEAIDEIQAEINQQTKNLKSYQKSAEKEFRALQNSWSEFLGPFREMTPKEFIKAALNEDNVLERLHEFDAYAEGYQIIHNYSSLITFVIGNPEKTIVKLRKQQTEPITDPDHNRKYTERIDQHQLIAELFDEKFGPEAAGLRQRLNVSQWGLMQPLNNEQWARFLDRQLENKQWDFNQAQVEAKIRPAKLVIDPSVRELMWKEGIVPNEGARVYFERADQLIGSFSRDLVTRMIDSKASQRPATITWTFNPAKREFLVEGQSKDGRLVLRERADVRRIDNSKPEVKLDDYDRKRIFANKAGQIVTGLALFGSLPANFRLDADQSEWALATLWTPTSKPRYTSTLDYVRIALGSNTTQNMMRDGFAPLSEPTLRFSMDMLKQLAEDLQRREEQYSHFVKRDESGKKSYDSYFPKPEGISSEVFEALAEATEFRRKATLAAEKEKSENAGDISAQEMEALQKALRALHRDVQNVLLQNTELISSLMRLMEDRWSRFQNGQMQSPEITSTDIQYLIQQNKDLYQAKPTWWQRTFGKKNNQPLLITPEKVSQAQGTIGTQEHPFFRENHLIMKEGGWKRFWRAFFGTPQKQRPLQTF